MKRCPKCNFLMKILPPHAEVAVLPFLDRDNKEVQGPQYQSLCQICIGTWYYFNTAYISMSWVDNRSNCHCFWNCGKIQDKKIARYPGRRYHGHDWNCPWYYRSGSGRCSSYICCSYDGSGGLQTSRKS